MVVVMFVGVHVVHGAIWVIVDVGVVGIDPKVIGIIAIIGNEGNTLKVAGELDRIRVDLVDGGEEGLVAIDNNSFVRVMGRSSNLRVVIPGDAVGSFSTSGCEEVHTVRADVFRVVFIVVIVVVVMLVIVVIVNGVVMMNIVVVAVVVTMEGVAWVYLSVSAVANLGANRDHVVGEGELLAVEDQSLLGFLELVLGVLASLLELLDAVVDRSKALVHLLVVFPDILLVCSNSLLLIVVPVVDSLDVAIKVVDGVLHGLESNKHLGLNLDALLVIVLVPDLVIRVELPNLLVEVGTGENLTVLVLVGGSVVAWVGVVVFTVVVFDGPSGRLVGGFPIFDVGLKTDCVNRCCDSGGNNSEFEHFTRFDYYSVVTICEVTPPN